MSSGNENAVQIQSVAIYLSALGWYYLSAAAAIREVINVHVNVRTYEGLYVRSYLIQANKMQTFRNFNYILVANLTS